MELEQDNLRTRPPLRCPTEVLSNTEGFSRSSVIDALKRDDVVIIRGLNIKDAEYVIETVANDLGLLDGLRLQAALSELREHRSNIGRYFMTVQKRDQYHVITPHSEGDEISGIQLAAFYCVENETDGGQTILMNVDSSSTQWEYLKEMTTRVIADTKMLSPGDAARGRAIYRLRRGDDFVRPADRVIRLISDMPLARVLAQAEPAYSSILDKDIYVLWDTIGGVDSDLMAWFYEYLKELDLIVEPLEHASLEMLDCAALRRFWSSGVDYDQLFKGSCMLKLRPGDMVIHNNLTWTHAANNWTPGQGKRNVVAAFA